MKSMLRSVSALTLALAVSAWVQPRAAQAQDPPLFPFAMPWNNVAGASPIIDVSFLNAMPAGVNGPIVVKNGHFAEAGTGKRIRFLGINLFGMQNSPQDGSYQADADAIAAHLARQGYNLVRLTALDDTNAQDEPTADTLFDPTGADTNHLDLSPGQLNNLDYLIYALKQKGIYTDLILHGSRTLASADTAPGITFPSDINLLPGLAVGQFNLSFDKRVDEFDPAMIAADQKFASDLLTHVNSKTGLNYAADPAVAVVEINNENSLTGDLYGPLGMGLESLPPFYQQELVHLWNAWLSAKYQGSDAKLNTAWLAGTGSGPGLLSNSSQWEPNPFAGNPPAQATASFGGTSTTGAPEIDITTTAISSHFWDVQALIWNLSLTNNTTYAVSFRAKYTPLPGSTQPPPVLPYSVSYQDSPWNSVGLPAGAAQLSSRWQTFSATFTASGAVAGQSRIVFQPGGCLGTVSIQNLQLAPSAVGAGLPAGQSLTTGTVAIPTHLVVAPQQDWLSFLADTEASYAQTMRTYLKTTLHVKSNVICSQMGFGELTSLGREAPATAPMDFADNHAYWDHPTYPLGALFGSAPVVSDKPMVNSLAAGSGDTLLALAQYRVAGLPYSVSEYNHPWPNDFRAEALPELASFAAFQDWDVITLFDEGGYGVGLQNNGTTSAIQGPFDCSEPAKAVFVPAAAMLFRAAEIPTASNSAVVTAASDQLIPQQLAATAWTTAASGNGNPNLSPLTQRLAIELGAAGTGVGLQVTHSAHSPRVNLPALSILPQSGTASGAVYTASANAAQALTGYVGGQTISLGGTTFTFPVFGVSPATFSPNFAAIILTAMDQKPLARSHSLLLTLVGRVENTNEQWNTSPVVAGTTTVPVHSYLTTAGTGPIVAQGIPATITLTTTDSSLHLWALTASGARAAQLPAPTYANGKLTFSVGPQYNTLWYELADQ